MWRSSMYILCSGLFIYLMICLGFFLLQEKLLFHPVPAQSSTLTPNFKYQSGELRLHGWLLQAGNPSGPTIIFFGGNADDVSQQIDLAEQYQARNLLLLPYRGYAGNPGLPNEQRLYQDAAEAISHYLKTYSQTAEKLVIIGRSLGTGVAVEMTQRFQSKAVILISPYDSISHVASIHFPWLPITKLNRNYFDSISKAPKIKSRLLVIAAADDKLVPAELSQALYQSWAGPAQYTLIPNHHHNNIDQSDLFWQSINRFLNSLTP